MSGRRPIKRSGKNHAITYLKSKTGSVGPVKKNPCAVLMNDLFSCWASVALHAEECKSLQKEVVSCYETPRPKSGANSTNFHTQRMFPRLARKD
ncbi:uncharacterized protein V1516DRAFT_674977, partial [Lipomyces oligophaga]|uniref:uncharacterized protein n=1 Tax=Lipomyces oligophaga TaxID=45792 RepID=UPI0034CF942B